jgi:dipeptidyl aminopeptidase/acylaminoacyl peptidase
MYRLLPDPAPIFRLAPRGFYFRFSPKGNEVAYYDITKPPVKLDHLEGKLILEYALYISDLEGNGRRAVTEVLFDDRFAFPPAWSPDNKMLAATHTSIHKRGTDGWCWHGHLILIDREKKKTRELLHKKEGFLSNVAWSPDGQYLAVSYFGGVLPDVTLELSVLRPDGKKVWQTVVNKGFVIGGNQTVAWSPDGKQLALAAGDYLYVVEWKNKALRRVCNQVGLRRLIPQWSEDSRSVALVTFGTLAVIDTQSGKARDIRLKRSIRRAVWVPGQNALLVLSEYWDERGVLDRLGDYFPRLHRRRYIRYVPYFVAAAGEGQHALREYAIPVELGSPRAYRLEGVVRLGEAFSKWAK